MDSKIIIMLVIMFVFIGFIVAAMIFALKKANVKQDIVLDQEQSDSTQAISSCIILYICQLWAKNR